MDFCMVYLRSITTSTVYIHMKNILADMTICPSRQTLGQQISKVGITGGPLAQMLGSIQSAGYQRHYRAARPPCNRSLNQ